MRNASRFDRPWVNGHQELGSKCQRSICGNVYSVGHIDCLVDVMRDKNDRCAEFPPGLPQKVLHIPSCLDVSACSNGSSMSSTSGLFARDCIIAVSGGMPPESSCGYAFANPVSSATSKR